MRFEVSDDSTFDLHRFAQLSALTIEYGFDFTFTPSCPGSESMEFDRRLGEISPPVRPMLRLYTWDRPTISYGCHQNPVRRLQLDLCARDGIPVVRRPTGGRELLHGHDLCYTVAWPFPDGIKAVEARHVFARISDTLVFALKDTGIEARWDEFRNRPQAIDGPCFVQIDLGEIIVGGKKLVASAQRVYDKCIIQQGSIPLHKPVVNLLEYLYLKEKHLVAEKLKATTAFLDECGGNAKSAVELVEPFKSAFGVLFGEAKRE